MLRLAGLLHDIGKPATRRYEGGKVSFHHHEVVGAQMAERRLRALRFPNDVIEPVVALVEMHLRFHTFRMGWSDSAVRRYVRDAGPLLDRLNRLVRADCTTRNKRRAARPPADPLRPSSRTSEGWPSRPPCTACGEPGSGSVSSTVRPPMRRSGP